MADEDTIVVDDTSPTILYFPFADTSGTPDFTAGWNPLFNSTSLGGAPLNVENSTTVHVTSRNDASFLINFQGTGIQLMGSATQAQYQVSVDNNVLQTYSPDPTNHILANISGLSNTNHTFILTTKTISNAPRNQTQSFIVFDKAIITSPVPSSNFSLQSLADNTISFFGNWNHSNPASLHQSNTVKDRACASFKGTSLQILGTVLPTGANYSVRLDNITTQSSARTSFTQDNALLFFSGSLDPNTTHTYEITNESGGALILAMGGAKVFASGDPNANASCTPSSPVFPVGAAFKSALSPGTIAALTLAGILGFLVITGMLFFFFVYRPRKKRREFLKRTTRPMPGPSDLILDIAPRFNGQQNDDYVRWKRDVEGASASKDLGIIFRRTPSPKDKSKSSNFDLDGAAENEELSARSFSFSRSSKNGGSKGSRAGSLKSWLSSKKKGSSSSTPSYTIDLPPLRTQNPPPHTPSESRPDLSKTSESHLQPRSSFSGITSLSYLSSSSTASHQFSFNRPGESSPNLHGRTDNHGLLLIDDNVEHLDPSVDNVSVYPATASTQQQAPQVFVEDVASSYEESVQSRPSRNQRLSRNTSTRTDDRGSVRTYDDGLSVLGASTARAAIRGLSPRTSESVSSFATFGVYPSRRTDESFPGHLSTLEESPPIPSTSVPTTEREPKSATLLPDHPVQYVDVRASSPFQIDFGHPLPPQPRSAQDNRGFTATTRPNRMSVRFDEDQVISPTNRQENTSGVAKPLPKPPQASFRLTPLAPLVQSGSSPPGSSAIDSPSFLDFDNAGSSNASRRTSNEHASSRGSRPQSTSFFSRPVGARSRWSTTTPSSHNQQESISSPSSQLSADLSSPSYSFPFPTSLPASPHHPEGHKPSPPIFPGVVPGAENNGSSRAEIHLSELNPISPVESVPMSISDLHFRQSESDDISENGFPRRLGFHLPPHPPLPAIPPTPTQPVTNTSGADPPASAPMSRGSLPLLFDSPTPVAPVTTRQTGTHTRSLSNDLLNSQSRRPLGPRVRDSHH